MKYRILVFLVVCSVSFISNSCNKSSSEDHIVTNMDVPTIKAALTTGEWHISYFFDSNKEETDNYSGYNFTFGTDGVLGATDGNTALSGSWSIMGSNNGDDDSHEEGVDFNIFFASPEAFVELSEDWHITSYTGTEIKLIHISGGDGGTDYLTFNKN